MRSCLLPLALLAGGGPACAAEDPPLAPSINDFGSVGLIQMPSARMGRDGDLYGGVSFVDPNLRYSVTLKALPFLEATFRYTDIRNQLYSSNIEFSGRQTYKDRGLDLKLLLFEETDRTPQVAVGLRDVAGTAVFGAEYIVASKRFHAIDISLGLGWGNMGTRGHFRNPLGLIADGFNRRGGSEGPGEVALDYFRGPTVSLFGGITIDTPIDGLRLKLEYDGNDYSREFGGDQFPVASPINVALEYTPIPELQASIGFERGNEVMVRVHALTNLHAPSRLPKFDPPPTPVQPRPADRTVPSQATVLAAAGAAQAPPARATDRQSFERALAAKAEAVGLTVTALRLDDREVTADVAAAARPPSPERLTELARFIAFALPAPAERVAVNGWSDGSVALRIAYDRRVLIQTASLAGLAALEPDLATGGPPATPASATSGPDAVDVETVAQALEAGLAEQDFQLLALDLEDRHARIHVSQGRYRRLPKAVGRVLRIAANTLPSRIEAITVVLVEVGLEAVSVSVQRSHFERAATYQGSAEEVWYKADVAPAEPSLADATYRPRGLYPRFQWGLMPRVRQTLGRPEAFYLYQIWAQLSGQVELSRGLSVSGSFGFDLYNNFDKMKVPSDSVLPRVRSDIKEYLQQGENGIYRLQADYLFDIATNWYGRVSAGIFEQMFGGIGGEVLYRRPDRPWAVGLDLNWVRQRDYDQRLRFRDYEVVTGHLTGYYEFRPYDIDVRLKLGRYLAGDVGATLEVARTFRSGVRVGAFATKTDVSAEEFGEGSFDKGFFITIPLDMWSVRSSRSSLAPVYRPLTRDGGQTLVISKPLYEVLRAASINEFERNWNTLLD